MSTERKRVLGSFQSGLGALPSVLGPDGAERAFFGQRGETSTTEAGNLFGRPGGGLSDAEICMLWSGWRELRLTLNYVSSEYQVDLVATFARDGVANTSNLKARALDGAPPIWMGSATGTESIDGGATTETAAYVGFMEFSTPSDWLTTDPDPQFFYRTDTGLWLPNFGLSLQNAGSHTLECYGFFTVPTPDSELKNVPVGPLDYPAGIDPRFSLYAVVFPTVTVTSCTGRLEVTKWFKYRDKDGLNPVWDEDTGEELHDHGDTSD